MSSLGKTAARGEIRKVKALAILRAKLTSGKSDAMIAADFGISINTVGRLSREAAQSGIVQHFEDQLLSDLVPSAVNAVKMALAEGDAHVALEILKGAGLLKKQAARTNTDEQSGDSLDIYIRAKRTGQSGSLSLPAIATSALAPLSPLECFALTSGEPSGPPGDSPVDDLRGVQDEEEPEDDALAILDAELADDEDEELT